eukprot:scaffold3226_cov160-Amphora_coffeaeformis.AAC.7
MKTLLSLLCLSFQASSVNSFSSSTAAPRGATVTSTRGQHHSHVRFSKRAMARGSPLWVSQMPGSNSFNNYDEEQGGDPTMQMLKQNQMRAKRLMTQGRLIRDQIEESPFKMSFIWLSDQLIALTSHLRDRYEVLQYYALRREEDRLELTPRNIELFEWVESELAEVESQLEDYGRLVASTLRASPDDDTLQAELRELSMLSQDIQEHVGDQLPSERDVKYQQLKRAYEKAQISLGRLNQLRHELYAVEEALDEMEGPFFMNLENNENGVYPTMQKTATVPPPPPVTYPSDRKGSRNSETDPVSKMANTWEGLTTFPYERSQPSNMPDQDNRGIGFERSGADDTWRGPYAEPEQDIYERAMSSKAREYNPESWDNFVRFWGDFTSPKDDNGASVDRKSPGKPNKQGEKLGGDTDLPNHYEAVAEWASKQPSRTSVEQVMFQLRNQRVAMETVSTGSSTRWGDMEVARAVAFAEMVWDTLDKKFPDTIQQDITTDSRKVEEEANWSPQKSTKEWLASTENAPENVETMPSRTPQKSTFNLEESKASFSSTPGATRQINSQNSNPNDLKQRDASQIFENGKTNKPSTPQTRLNSMASTEGGTTGSVSKPTANDALKQNIQMKTDNGGGWSPGEANLETAENTERKDSSSFQTTAKSMMNSPTSFPESTKKTAAGSLSTATPGSSPPKSFSQRNSMFQEVRKINIKFPKREEAKPPAVTGMNDKSNTAQGTSNTTLNFPANSKSPQGTPPKASETSSDTTKSAPWSTISSSSSKLDKSSEESSDRTVSFGGTVPQSGQNSGNDTNPPTFRTPWNSLGNQSKVEKKDTWSTQTTGIGASTPWGSPGGPPAKMEKNSPEEESSVKPSSDRNVSLGSSRPQAGQKSGDGANPPPFSAPWSSPGNQVKPGKEGFSSQTRSKALWTSPGTPPVKLEKDSENSFKKSSDEPLGDTKQQAGQKSGDRNPPTFNMPWKSTGGQATAIDKKDTMFRQTSAASANTPWSSPGGSSEKKDSWSPQKFSKDGQAPSASSPWNSFDTAAFKTEKEPAWSPQKSIDSLKTSPTNSPWNPTGASPSKLEKKDSWSPQKTDEASANKVGNAPWNSLGTPPAKVVKKEPWSPPKDADAAGKRAAATPWPSSENSSPLVEKKASWVPPKNTESTKAAGSSMPWGSVGDKQPKTGSPEKPDNVAKSPASNSPWNSIGIPQSKTDKKDAWSPQKNTTPGAPWARKDAWSPQKNTELSNKIETNTPGTPWAKIERKDSTKAPNTQAANFPWKFSGTASPKAGSDDESSQTSAARQNRLGSSDDVSRSPQQGPTPMATGNAPWKNPVLSSSNTQNKTPWSQQKSQEDLKSKDTTSTPGGTPWAVPGSSPFKVEKKAPWSPQKTAGSATLFTGNAPWNVPGAISSAQKQGGWSPQRPKEKFSAARTSSNAPESTTGVKKPSWGPAKSTSSTTPGTNSPWNTPGMPKAKLEQTSTWETPQTNNSAGVSAKSAAPGTARGTSGSPGINPNFGVRTQQLGAEEIDVYGPVANQKMSTSSDLQQKTPWPPQQKNAPVNLPWNAGPSKTMKNAGLSETSTENSLWNSSGSSAKAENDAAQFMPKKTIEEKNERSPGIVEGFGRFTHELGVNGGVLDSSYDDIPPPKIDLSARSPGINPNFGMRTQQLGAEEIDIYGAVSKSTSSSRNDSRPQIKVSPDFGRFSQQLGAQEMGPSQSFAGKRSGQPKQPGGAFTSDQGRFSPQLGDKDIGPRRGMPMKREEVPTKAEGGFSTSRGGGWFPKQEDSAFSRDQGNVPPQYSNEETGLSQPPFQSTKKQEPPSEARGAFSTGQAGKSPRFGEMEMEQDQRAPTNKQEQPKITDNGFSSGPGGFPSLSQRGVNQNPAPPQMQRQGSQHQSASRQDQPSQPGDASAPGQNSFQTPYSRRQRPSSNSQQQPSQAGGAFTSDQGRFTPMGPGQREQMSRPQRSRQPRGAFTSDQGRFSPHLVEDDIGPKKRAPPRRLDPIGGETWDTPGRGSAWSQSSASVPPPQGKILSPDQRERDWGANDGPRPTELYRGRTQRVASSAAAGKSRWGRMENEKAMFMTNTPAPWETTTAQPPKPQQMRDPSSGNSPANAGGFSGSEEKSFPSDTQDFGTRNYADQPKKVHRYRPPTQPMAQGYSQSGAASNPPRGYTPLAPDTLVKEWGIQGASGSRGLYDSRSNNVAASAASGRSRWGAMENQRASYLAGTENVVPRPPDDVFDLRTRNAGGEPRLTNDHMEYHTGRRASGADDYFARSNQSFGSPEAENRFRSAEWNHQASDWSNDNPDHARIGEDINEDERWY